MQQVIHRSKKNNIKIVKHFKKDGDYSYIVTEVREAYFPNENHGTTENKNYWKTAQTIEIFNNGCLTYRQLILRLAKSCQDRNKNLHKIVEKYIVSFGSYKPKFN